MRSHLAIILLYLTIFVIVSASDNDKTDGHSTFIATVRDKYNLHKVAAQVNRRGAGGSGDWSGSVHKTHDIIRVLIIHGESHTCDVLRQVAGIDTCEADSIISINE